MLDRTGVRLSDVAGCESAKEALEEVIRIFIILFICFSPSFVDL